MEKVFPEAAFEWDEYNTNKIWERHGVKYTECEDVFFDERIKILPDPTHSQTELRSIALGKTKTGRLLFIAFTERRGKILVISVRDMSKKERKAYP